jgi:hypothetical protein
MTDYGFEISIHKTETMAFRGKNQSDVKLYWTIGLQNRSDILILWDVVSNITMKKIIVN